MSAPPGWDPERDYQQALAWAEAQARKRRADQRFADAQAGYYRRRTRELAAQVAGLTARLDALDPGPPAQASSVALASPRKAADRPPSAPPAPGQSMVSQPGGVAWMLGRWRARGWKA